VEATAGRQVCGLLDALAPPRLTTGVRGWIMLRFLAMLLCALTVGTSGCRTSCPETRAMWKKYGMIKVGMAEAEVHAILPAPHGGVRDGRDASEVWSCSTQHWHNGILVRHGWVLEVAFDGDGRVKEAKRHRSGPIEYAPVEQVNGSRP
jgi:hypothetical protein